MFVHKTQGINKANKLREAIENEQKKILIKKYIMSCFLLTHKSNNRFLNHSLYF